VGLAARSRNRYHTRNEHSKIKLLSERLGERLSEQQSTRKR
jgi:hypothetical protein